MFINMGDEIINIDNIKRFYIEEVQDDTGKTIWFTVAETFETEKYPLRGSCTEDEAIERIKAVSEELKKKGLLIEV